MKHYTTLEQLRADRLKVRQSLSKNVKRLKSDVKENYLPKSNSLMGSSNPVFNMIGYGIAGYQTARNVRNVIRFLMRIF